MVHYYQLLDDIGKEKALIMSLVELDSKEYREISKEYFIEVVNFLIESADVETE